MQMVTPAQIGNVMGLLPLPVTMADLESRVQTGLPKSALTAGVQHIATDTSAARQLRDLVIPEASFKRRRDRLTPEESARTERLARVYATAEYVWNNEQAARTFLATSHPFLEGRKPLNVSMTEIGARRVETLLWQIFYGVQA